MISVAPSNPPWKARKPNVDRSSTCSRTPGWESSSENMSAPPQGMVGRHLYHRDMDAVGVGDPHLPQTPWFGARCLQDRDTCRLQLIVGAVDVTHLEPQFDVPGGR